MMDSQTQRVVHPTLLQSPQAGRRKPAPLDDIELQTEEVSTSNYTTRSLESEGSEQTLYMPPSSIPATPEHFFSFGHASQNYSLAGAPCIAAHLGAYVSEACAAQYNAQPMQQQHLPFVQPMPPIASIVSTVPDAHGRHTVRLHHAIPAPAVSGAPVVFEAGRQHIAPNPAADPLESVSPQQCPSATSSSPNAPVLASPGLPSLGSEGHVNGNCKPCAFFHGKGCEGGVDCRFCHLCEVGEKKRRHKEKLANRRQMRHEQMSGRRC